MKTPGRHHPAGHDLPRGHRGREASTRSHHDADSRAKVEYRTSSTPAHTDELDLLHSTNNAPTTTRGRSTLRIADNTRCTNNGCQPTNPVASGLVKVNTGDFAPGQTTAENGWIVNVYESRPREHPHCGQQEPAPSLVHTHELPGLAPPAPAPHEPAYHLATA